MSIRTLTTAAAALLLALALAACSSDTMVLDDQAAMRATPFTATFSELNDSGGSGQATVVAKGDTVRVNLDVEGLLDGVTHLQHIHGFGAGTVAACPTPEDDLDGDGLVSLLEGAPVYGPIRVTIGTDTTGSIEYSRTFGPDDATLPIGPVGEKHIIVHGVDIDGDGTLQGTKDLNGDGVIGDPAPDPEVENTPAENLLFLTEATFELTMPALCGDLDRAGRSGR